MTTPGKTPTVANIIAQELGLDGDFVLSHDHDQNKFALGSLAPTDGTCYIPIYIPLSTTNEVLAGMPARYNVLDKTFVDYDCEPAHKVAYPSPKKLEQVRQAMKMAGFPGSKSIPPPDSKNKAVVEKLSAKIKKTDRATLETGDHVQVRILDKGAAIHRPKVVNAEGFVGRIEDDGSFYVWTTDDFYFRGEDQGRVVRVRPGENGKFEFAPSFASGAKFPITLRELPKKSSK